MEPKFKKSRIWEHSTVVRVSTAVGTAPAGEGHIWEGQEAGLRGNGVETEKNPQHKIRERRDGEGWSIMEKK